MAMALIVLALGSVLAGYIGVPAGLGGHNELGRSGWRRRLPRRSKPAPPPKPERRARKPPRKAKRQTTRTKPSSGR